MPRVGPVYSLPAGYEAVLGEVIQPSQHNPPLEDIAQALTDSLPRNGTGPMTGNLAMGSNKITGLAAGTSNGDAVRFEQLPASSAWLTSVSALSLAADEMVYANGANTAAKTALTAFARNLLDDVDAAAMRTTLALGTAATQTLTNAAATIAASDDDTHVPSNAAVIDYVQSHAAIMQRIDEFSNFGQTTTTTALGPNTWQVAELVFQSLSLSGTDNISIIAASNSLGDRTMTSSGKMISGTTVSDASSASVINIPMGNAALTVSGRLSMRRERAVSGGQRVIGEYTFFRSDNAVISGGFSYQHPANPDALAFKISASGANTFDTNASQAGVVFYCA